MRQSYQRCHRVVFLWVTKINWFCIATLINKGTQSPRCPEWFWRKRLSKARYYQILSSNLIPISLSRIQTDECQSYISSVLNALTQADDHSIYWQNVLIKCPTGNFKTFGTKCVHQYPVFWGKMLPSLEAQLVVEILHGRFSPFLVSLAHVSPPIYCSVICRRDIKCFSIHDDKFQQMTDKLLD